MSILSVVVVLCSLELFLRFWKPYSVHENRDLSEVKVGISKFDGSLLEGETNSLGLRDKEYDVSHTTYRILAIGDSFTYGYKLKNVNSWPKKAEAYLQKNGYANVEILNGGRPGTDTRWQYQFFTKYTSKYSPNMVVIAFLINDCTSLCSNCGPVKLKNAFDAAIKDNSGIFKLYLARYIRLAYLKYGMTKNTIKEYHIPYKNHAKEYQDCKDAFLAFKKASDNKHFKLIVVIYPMLYHLDKQFPFSDIHEQMISFFESVGIKAYDLTAAFYGFKDVDLWISDDDSHPNKIANEIAGKKIAEIITEYFGSSRPM